MSGIAWPWRKQARRVDELSARAVESQRRAQRARVEADRLARQSRAVTSETRQRLSQDGFAGAIAELWSGGHP